MIKRAIISAGDLEALAEVPTGAGVVLDFAERPYDSLLPAAIEERRFRLDRVLLTSSSLSDPRIEGFLEGRTAARVRVTEELGLRDALAGARRVAKPWVELELPLESQSDLDVLKVLSSLGVRTRLDVRRLARHDELLSDAIADALLATARRASLGPIAEIERHFFDDGFELASLDLRANDHYVDLRAGTPAESASWEIPDIAEKRVPFLLDRHPCAFCEGLGLCHGYLLDAAAAESPCRSVFSEIVEAVDLARARVPAQGTPASRRRRGPGPGQPRARGLGAPAQLADGARGGPPSSQRSLGPSPQPGRRGLPIIAAEGVAGPASRGRLAPRRGRC